MIMGNQGSSRGKIVGLVTLGVVVVAVVGFFVVMGKQYFDNRYAGSMYYTQVPVDEPVAVGDLFDMNGNVADKGYSYTLVGYNDEGEEQLLEFDVRTDNPDFLYQPGTYLQVEASSSLVLGEEPIDESDIPAAALERIRGE